MHLQLGDVCAHVRLAWVVDRATDILLQVCRGDPGDGSNHYGVVRERAVGGEIGSVREEEVAGFAGLAKRRT